MVGRFVVSGRLLMAGACAGRFSAVAVVAALLAATCALQQAGSTSSSV